MKKIFVAAVLLLCMTGCIAPGDTEEIKREAADLSKPSPDYVKWYSNVVDKQTALSEELVLTLTDVVDAGIASKDMRVIKAYKKHEDIIKSKLDAVQEAGAAKP
jgi:hypothetical protein